MDPPPLLPATATTVSTTAAASMQLSYTDSQDSSPKSRNADAPPPWGDVADQTATTLPQVVPGGGSKLRLMCSYGGHIIPRPHDKSLCYVGGDTRMIVIDRHASLAELSARLSKMLLEGRPFSLKYQLPSEDLDSLISVTTDEDLENLVEEYDRAASATSAKASSSSSRIRLFLFFGKPETTESMGALLHEAKSEAWFVDALNGSRAMPRNLSDSATMDCLLTGAGIGSCNDLPSAVATASEEESHGGFFGENSSESVKPNLAEVHSISESAFVETNTSSSGSSTSSPPGVLPNLPQIRVRVDANVAGLVHQGHKPAGVEEQFAQISFAAPTVAAPMVAVNSGGGETMNRINSEDDISGQNVPVMFRKPPLPVPLQPPHFKQNDGGNGGGGGYSLPPPDSVASDSSIGSANSLSKPIYYQEQVQVVAREARAPVSPNAPSEASSDQGSRNQVQQVQDSGYSIPPQSEQQQQNQLQQQQQHQQQMLQQHQHQQQQQLQQQHLQQQQQQQQQFVHASAQYMSIQHPVPGQVPVSPYYTMYAPPPSQQPLHHQIDHQQQYPVYIMPVPQPQQPYKMALQSTVTDPTVVTTTNIASQNPAAYNDSIPPIYPPPPKAASPAMPEMTQSHYQTSVPTPQLVQIPSSQYQPQFVSYSQMHHPSQSIAVPPSATAPSYGYEYANPSHEQVYYTQHQAVPLPPQYQSMTPAAAAAAIATMSDEAKQLPPYPAAADQSNTPKYLRRQEIKTLN